MKPLQEKMMSGQGLPGGMPQDFAKEPDIADID
jgi:hypothetical protein